MLPRDDSKAKKNCDRLLAELEEAQAELAAVGEAAGELTSPTSLADFERRVKAAADRVQSLTVAFAMQQTIMSETRHGMERQLFATSPKKKWKNYGYRPVTVRVLGGMEVRLMVRYWAYHENRAHKGKGVFAASLLFGLCEKCTPALASEVAQLAAALNSFDDARQRLKNIGVMLSVKRIAQVAYRFSQRARQQQLAQGMGIDGSLAGRRVVISTDGGRVRIRRTKRGKKTKKGGSRYHTDWREPKLLVIYVVDEDGRMSKEFTPVLDGTLKGPDAVFDLLASYLKELQLQSADKVLFIADGAKWIWNRVGDLWDRLNISPEQRLELVDYYHVVEHLNKLANLNKKQSAAARKRWATRQRNRLLNGDVATFIDAVKAFTKGRRSKDWRRERDYLIRNANAGRLDYAAVRQHQLPIGSGTMESTVRRVVNLRMKGASIFWTVEHAEDMLLLRAYYKAKQWNTIEKKALSTNATLAL